MVVAVLACVGYWLFHGKSETAETSTTFTGRRGPLNITVLEGGSFEALESQEVKSEVQGQTKILFIVEEGYGVTQEDVDNGKILVELDSKDLVDKQTAQELEYQSACAAFAEAKGEYEIQINQNESDIVTAELAVKFARMDFEKFMGVASAKEILTKLGLNDIADDSPPAPKDESKDESTTAPPRSDASAPRSDASAPRSDAAAKSALPPQNAVKKAHAGIDFSKYADTALLGDGQARQLLRKCEDDLVLAMKELGLAQTLFEGTKRLAAKEFVTTNDLDNERLKVERSEIGRKSMETAKDLFIKYEFPKQAETLLSGYEESLRKLERARQLAISKLAQAEAKLKAADQRYKLQSIRRKEIQEQIAKCKIKAERVGLVVYANEDNWRNDDRIQEGAMVRERQKIITIPDMTTMVVKVKIHEASIKSIQKGQKARVRVDAYPEEELVGEVAKVGVLPDSQNRWMNPDMKVYETSITIEGEHDWIKPGMSAQAEILVKELPDVVYVPIQAVSPSDGEKVCFVAGFGGVTRRVVEVGEFNNEFIEIKSGLKEGEQVLLRAPVVPEEADKESKGKEDKKEKGAAPGKSETPAPEKTKPEKPL